MEARGSGTDSSGDSAVIVATSGEVCMAQTHKMASAITRRTADGGRTTEAAGMPAARISLVCPKTGPVDEMVQLPPKNIFLQLSRAEGRGTWRCTTSQSLSQNRPDHYSNTKYTHKYNSVMTTLGGIGMVMYMTM